MDAERKRLEENRKKIGHWNRWGPYLSLRQWGTVREDYSANGDAWNYFPFEMAHTRAYRWGEDGLLGFSDNHQFLCFSFAFWNGKDPILKERFFGLSNLEGNHGEDVKECYYYLDALPSHAYMKALYKYPHERFPYEALKEENRKRGLNDPEFELLDTKIFDGGNYFDLFIEYIKVDPEDLFIQLTIENRGEKASLTILSQLWLKNVWSWKRETAPCTFQEKEGALFLEHPKLGPRYLYSQEKGAALFTENETNEEKAFGKKGNTPHTKDSFHRYLIEGEKGALSSDQKGTKAAYCFPLEIEKGGKKILRFRFCPEKKKDPFADFDATLKEREEEKETFYQSFVPKDLSEERKMIQRQAFASLLWSKQFYHYVVEEWLQGDDPKAPPPQEREKGRNSHWKHVYNDDILSMPDKWEYPWFASWDLAFHCIVMAVLDPTSAKRQLGVLTREWYMHPNGQIPAYEWDFGDVNPPVLSWAAWRVYKIEQKKHGREDRDFLEEIFQKLIMNFTWWVNRQDADGKNVFEGGFLGLDNISIFNRSQQFPEGAKLIQSDATSWMAMFCLNMWTMAMELAQKEPSYEDMASKFFEHFLYIADAINYSQDDAPPIWDEEDGFYYDLLCHPGGRFERLKVHSLVGLIPLFAVASLEEEELDALPEFKKRFLWFLERRKDLCAKVACLWSKGEGERRTLALLDQNRLQKILAKMLSEEEFLSPYGVRSVSKYHEKNPFILKCQGGISHQVDYEPGESHSRLFGGNSNWRGPIWFPINYLIIEALQKHHYYYGDSFQVECPKGSGKMMHLGDVAKELSRRLMRLFEKEEGGNRPVFEGISIYQKDPHFQNYLLFHEYFHGDTGKGLGASHQTGWTALIAKLIQQSGA